MLLFGNVSGDSVHATIVSLLLFHVVIRQCIGWFRTRYDCKFTIVSCCYSEMYRVIPYTLRLLVYYCFMLLFGNVTGDSVHATIVSLLLFHVVIRQCIGWLRTRYDCKFTIVSCCYSAMYRVIPYTLRL